MKIVAETGSHFDLQEERSRDFLEDVLARPLFAHLATGSELGPRESPVWFLWEDEAVWIIGHYKTDSFPARIEREPRCALGIVDFNRSSGLVQHVGFRGRAQLHPHDAARLQRLLRRYLGARLEDWDARFVEILGDTDYVFVRFEPETAVVRDQSYIVKGNEIRKKDLIKRCSLILLLLALLIIPSGHAFAQKPDVDFGELEKVLLAELKETRTPGAVVAIVSGDRIVYAKGFGVSSVETNAPVTTDMLFRIASVTKMFTATALVTLAEQGKLKLDVPIGSYVPGLTPQLSQVTLHQLLTHTAGIVAESNRARSPDGNLATMVRGWKDDQIFFEHPGRIYSYSNPGLVLAGVTLQEIGHQPYDAMMTELLLKPLGMSRTTFRTTQAMTYPLSLGHDIGEDKKVVVVRPFSEEAENLPAGGMMSNVSDLSRFAIAFMNDGRLDGQQVLSPSVIAKLSTPYVDAHNVSGDWRQGYGMRVGSERGVRVVEHRGGTTGFGALLRMVPAHRFAVIILANSTLATLDKTTDKAMELMLPLQAKAAEKSETNLPLGAAEMNAYAGTYLNGTFKFQIFRKDEKLFLKLGDDVVPLKKTGERLLSIDEKPEEATAESALFRNLMFLPGADGRIEYLYFIGRALKRLPDAKSP